MLNKEFPSKYLKKLKKLFPIFLCTHPRAVMGKFFQFYDIWFESNKKTQFFLLNRLGAIQMIHDICLTILDPSPLVSF